VLPVRPAGHFARLWALARHSRDFSLCIFGFVCYAFAMSETVFLDELGRIQIPQHLRDAMRLLP
jgi:DNA-binding transcriptional regulator/RsmH inhibitor MraZ